MNTEDSSKTFVTGDHVVYGKFPEGAEASKGQLILKCPFGVLNLPKNQRNFFQDFCPSL